MGEAFFASYREKKWHHVGTSIGYQNANVNTGVTAKGLLEKGWLNMQQMIEMDKEAIFAEISGRLGIPGDPIHLLLRFLNTTTELTNVLYHLTEHDGYESTASILFDIQENIVKAERFLREEAFAALAQANREQGEYFTFDAPLPDGFLMESRDQGVHMEFPLWLFGHRKPKDIPPSFHKKRPYVREQGFWNALIRRMVDDNKPGVSVRRNLPEEARLEIRFKTRLKNARDLDHYHLSPFVNSLVYNGLLFSDHPSRLNYEITWQETSPKDHERVSIYLKYRGSTL